MLFRKRRPAPTSAPAPAPGLLIRTHHYTLLARNPDGTLGQSHILGDPADAIRVARLAAVAGALAPGARVIGDSNAFQVTSDDGFLSAGEADAIAWHSSAAGTCETFALVAADEIAAARRRFTDGAAEAARFAARIETLRAAGEPVKLHFGVGPIPIPGFLNADVWMNAPRFAFTVPDDYFMFPYVGTRIPVPDGVADFIFHEDFIEHVDQLCQIQFLAETWRILKPGGIHRVNTPDLHWTMAARSDFARGNDGVYAGERQWGHEALFTRSSLAETARMIGYSDIVFNHRGGSISPHAIVDRRPAGDRDEVAGNLFADLTK